MLLVSVYEVFPVNPEFNSILLQGSNMTLNIFKAIVQHFGNTYLLSGGELDKKTPLSCVYSKYDTKDSQLS